MKLSTAITSAALMAVCLCSTNVRADTTIFSENFSGATPAANYAAPNPIPGTGFTVTTSQVDIIGVLNGTFAACVVGGNCLDLVGSPGLGAITTTNPLSLIAGDTYTISYTNILQGFATGTTPTSEYTVQLGNSPLFDETAIPMVVPTVLSFIAPADDASAHLSFTTLTSPDDFHGAVISDIVVTQSGPTPAVPLPAALPLFATGLGGLALLGWRRKRKA